MQKKSVDVALKELNENGVFEGYASVFGVKDRDRDVVMKGAFAKSLEKWAHRGKKPPVLWQHKASEPIGFFSEMFEDDVGLYVKGQLLVDDIAQARAAYSLIKANAISGLSIGYMIEQRQKGADGVCLLEQLDLMEVSIVSTPANPEAVIGQVKQFAGDVMPSASELEAFLCEAGLSVKTAKQIVAHGVKSPTRDDEVQTAAEEALRILKSIRV